VLFETRTRVLHRVRSWSANGRAKSRLTRRRQLFPFTDTYSVYAATATEHTPTKYGGPVFQGAIRRRLPQELREAAMNLCLQQSGARPRYANVKLSPGTSNVRNPAIATA